MEKMFKESINTFYIGVESSLYPSDCQKANNVSCNLIEVVLDYPLDYRQQSGTPPFATSFCLFSFMCDAPWALDIAERRDSFL